VETEYVRRADIINTFQIWRTDLTQQIEENIEFPHIRSDLKVCRTQLDDCIHAVQDIPAADVRPVVRGEWEYISFMTVKCSNCKETFHELEGDNFCPNCGADMRGGNIDG